MSEKITIENEVEVAEGAIVYTGEGLGSEEYPRMRRIGAPLVQPLAASPKPIDFINDSYNL